VARAKRTHRAEARRRYRAAGATDVDFDAVETDEPTKPAPRSSSTSNAKATGTPERVGITDAFRQSIRPMHVREDVASLPWIALHTKALWLPVLITVASTVAIVTLGAFDVVTGFMFAYFVQTPAIGGVFIAGFLAPRASWLLGVIVGFVAAICYSLLVIVFPSKIVIGALPPPDVARDIVISAFILSPILGAFFAAAAAWYRRFLALSNPNRGRRQQQGSQKKTGDGRTRGSGTSQKAGAKR
jgi:hypothetical protein